MSRRSSFARVHASSRRRVCGEDKARSSPPVSLPLLVFASNFSLSSSSNPFTYGEFSIDFMHTAHSTCFLRLSVSFILPRALLDFLEQEFATPNVRPLLPSIVYLLDFSGIVFRNVTNGNEAT